MLKRLYFLSFEVIYSFIETMGKYSPSVLLKGAKTGTIFFLSLMISLDLEIIIHFLFKKIAYNRAAIGLSLLTVLLILNIYLFRKSFNMKEIRINSSKIQEEFISIGLGTNVFALFIYYFIIPIMKDMGLI